VLEDAGVKTITYSLGHSRGGNLRDIAVCDTPPSPPDLVHCAVIEHTLFVDWRGRVFICDHDLHGEHGLGDLMTEPLREILARRQKLIDDGLAFQLCRQCNDVLKGGFEPFAAGVGGVLSDWVYALHAASDGPAFPNATPAQRWILEIYQKENRLDRAVDRLLGIQCELQQRLREEQENREGLRKILMEEVSNRDRRIADLEDKLATIHRMPTWQIARWLAWCLDAMNDLAGAKRPTVQGRISRFFCRSVPECELSTPTV
jgi:hypothetical protein